MSDKPYQLPDNLILDLPDAPDFVSEPPQIGLIEMIQMCEKMLPYWNKKRFEELEKHKDTVPWEPFTL